MRLSLNKFSIVFGVIFLNLAILLPGSPALAQPPDVSDSAIELFLKTPFQYDYTTIVDDSTLYRFIMALDHQLAVIEYRQRREFTAIPDNPVGEQTFKRDLEARYRDILRDGYIFKILDQWRTKTQDPVNLAFIRFYSWRRNEFTDDPSAIRPARELSRRLADRLYNFHFSVDGQSYDANEAAQVIFSDGDIDLARQLQKLVMDSAAILTPEAAKLYDLYKIMGQQRGQRTSQDYILSRLSYNKADWLKIADDLKKATDNEYQRCFDSLQMIFGQKPTALFEIERGLLQGGDLPDSCFPPEKIDAAMNQLLDGLGMDSLMTKLIVRVDSSTYPALAVRLYPPDENLLLKNNRGGLANYRRLAMELGRSLPWAYADSTLPYLLRDYPLGSEEMLTQMFEGLALRPEFLSDNFDIAPRDIKRFETFRLWQRVADLRRVLLYFYFDYYLSNGLATDPAALYMSLEDSLFHTSDSSYQWIETLLTGGLESFPEKLADMFSAIKNTEILEKLYGDDFASNPKAGEFLIQQFCRPGRSQTIEDYMTAHAPDPLSIQSVKHQWHLR